MKTKLLILLFLAFFSSFAQTNLVPNGDFETWSSSSQPDNWFRYFNGFASQSTSAQNGSSSTNMKIVDGTLNYINSDYFPVVANKTYRITMYHKLVSGTFSSLDFSIYHKPNTFKDYIIKITDHTFSNTEWRKIEFDYTSTVSENIEVDIWTTGTLNSEILVDNVSVVDVAEIGAQYTLIPDVNFENKLIALGIDSGVADGKVLTSKINTLTSLDVSSSSIADLTGIQDFVGLTSLHCHDNQLTTLDVSENVSLVGLYCNSNQLTALDVSENVSLVSLDCSSNLLTAMDVSKNIALTYFDCYSNKLTALHISKNPALRSLTCFDNQLTSLDVSKNVALTNFDCNSNRLTALDVSLNVSLTSFACSYNQLTVLDVSKNTALTNLNCFENLLTSLDISKNVALIYFACYSNKLTALDVSKNTALRSLSCGSNKLTTLDVSQNIKLTSIYCRMNELTSLDVSKNVALKTLYCNTNNLVSLNLKNGKNTLFTALNLKDNPNLSCIQVDDKAYSDTNWPTFKDVTATYNVSCDYYTLIPDSNFENKLIALGIDTDGLSGKVLTSSISNLTSLDVSESGIVDLSGIEDFDALTILNCSSNKLTTLDVSKNLFLKMLYCSTNQLTSLDISNAASLAYLDCSSNQLTTLDVSKNNLLWNLHCQSNKLAELDISKNTALTDFICSSNQLTKLDISNQPKLWYLGCSSNLLTSLDVSKNILLWSLSCASNKLTALDVKTNTALEALYCSSNQLTSLNTNNQPKLTYFDCSSNQLASLDVSKNEILWNLSCNSNQLTYLNLQNKNNSNFNTISFIDNPKLKCILVDDVAYSNKNWTSKKDAIATYNTECTGEIILSSNNFAIKTKGESCLGENNGEIDITAKEMFSYVASVNGESKTFVNNSLNLSGLTSGTYTISITIPGEIFEQKFTVIIPKGATITGKSSVVANKVAVEIIEGTAPYTVFINGVEQFETSDASFTVETKKGGLLQVQTAKVCEGIYAKDIAGIEGAITAYPNPTSGNFEIELPAFRKEVVIGLYTLDGHLISNKTYNIESGKAQLTLANQPIGVYVIKIELDAPKYLKIIKN